MTAAGAVPAGKWRPRCLRVAWILTGVACLCSPRCVDGLTRATVRAVPHVDTVGLTRVRTCAHHNTAPQVKEHAELAWLLGCMTPLGWLRRMTQFKDKGKNQDKAALGLLSYPVLMAADILIYKATSESRRPPSLFDQRCDGAAVRGAVCGTVCPVACPVVCAVANRPPLCHRRAIHHDLGQHTTSPVCCTPAVPVGDDQSQHLELARSIASSFNHTYGQVFPVPEGIFPDGKETRVMSLRNARKKMSKSEVSDMSRINLTGVFPRPGARMQRSGGGVVVVVSANCFCRCLLS